MKGTLNCYEGASKSDIQMSVHRNINPNYNQQDLTFLDLFISTDALHVSGGSSAHHQVHCTYSFRYCQPILLLAASSNT